MDNAGFYRVLIFITLVGTIYVLAAGILIRKFLNRSRRTAVPLKSPQVWYERIVSALAGVGLLCAMYGYFVEPYWPAVTHIQIASTKLSEGAGPVRVALISDLHCDAKPRLEERLPLLIANENPDLILFTGDCLNSSDGLAVFQKCMTALAQLAPTFAVRGNWDMAYWSELDLFGGTGVVELDGRRSKLVIRGVPVSLSGLAIGHESRMDDLLDRARTMPSTCFCITILTSSITCLTITPISIAQGIPTAVRLAFPCTVR